MSTAYFIDLQASAAAKAAELAADMRVGPAPFRELADDAYFHAETCRDLALHRMAASFRRQGLALRVEADYRAGAITAEERRECEREAARHA